MPIANNEHRYYNAIAIATRSGYAAIKKYRAAGGGGWKAAYDALCANAAAREESNTAGERSNAESNRPPIIIPDPHEAYEQMASHGIRLVLAEEKDFPEALRHIPYPPFGIYFQGTLPLAKLIPGTTPPSLAIVGTRRASAEGKHTTRRFAHALAAAGCVITSGLAFGIDAAAHEGALDADGITIAVLAGGLDAIYPHSHRALAERVLDHGGALVSEYPPGAEPLSYRFIERNRIISGISRGTLIVEAPESSGALATARYAAEQNRELFVVPGAISQKNFAGSHALIRQGAELVTSPEDIFEAYGVNEIYKKESMARRSRTSLPEEILILNALAELSAPADVDKIITMTKLEPRVVNQTLSFLLIQGMIKESDAGYTI